MVFTYSFRRLRRYPALWWALVICVAGITGFAVTSSIYAAQASARQFGGLRSVAVVTHSMTVGSTLSASDVRTESRPVAFIADAPVVSQPVGRVLTQSVAAGDVVNENNAGAAGASAIAALVLPDQRAIAVSLGGLYPGFRVGDVVDVVASTGSDAASAEPATVLAHNARIVEVGDDHAMVSVPAETATRVAFASTNGTVVLALIGATG